MTQSTWLAADRSLRRRPTTSAARPPMPASTSSKTRVRTGPPVERDLEEAPSATHVFRASAMREISPPEATLSRGRGSSPGLADTRKRTSSKPPGDHATRSRSMRRDVRSMASEASSSSTRLASLRAASFLEWLRRPAASSYASVSSLSCLPSAARRSSAFSTAAMRVRTSSRYASTWSSAAPYLRFSLSSAARRDSISSRRSGLASRCER